MSIGVVVTLCIVSFVFGAIVWDFVIDYWHLVKVLRRAKGDGR